MAFIPVEHTGRFSVIQTFLGQTCVNVFWVHHAGTWTAGQLNTMAGFIAGAYETHIAPFLSDQWSLDKVVSQDYTSFNAASAEYSPGTAIVGTGSGDPLPPQVALVVSWRTDNRGRSYRGRTYLTGLTEFYADNGRMGQTVLTAVDNWAQGLMTLIQLADGDLGVVSFMANGAPRQAGVFTAISAYRSRDILYTQRRRTIGVGS